MWMKLLQILYFDFIYKFYFAEYVLRLLQLLPQWHERHQSEG
jgi:hypothetical protein